MCDTIELDCRVGEHFLLSGRQQTVIVMKDILIEWFLLGMNL